MVIIYFILVIQFSQSLSNKASWKNRLFSIVNSVNSRSDVDWIAHLNNSIIQKYSLQEIKNILLPSLYNHDDLEFFKTHPPRVYQNESYPPASFNTYKAFPQCKQDVRDQGKCGSCWALSGAEVLEDRFCVQKNIKVRLSPQDFVSCDKGDGGCRGGGMMSLWAYAAMAGLVTESCFPYAAVDNITCPEKCAGPEEDWYEVKHYAKNGGCVQFYSIEGAMNFMSVGGSIQGGFAVYEDFLTYKSGVYSHHQGEKLGYHAIKILGYDYGSWYCQNSWGTGFGMKGMFQIKKGTNECQIENNLWGTVADHVGKGK